MSHPARPGLLRVEPLEPRCTPVVGALAEAPITATGGGFDGVVEVRVTDGLGSGTLLANGRQILTAAHIVDDNGDHVADSDVTVHFDLPGRTVEMVVPAAGVYVFPGWSGLAADGRGGTDDLAVLDLPALAPSGQGGADRFGLYRGSDEVGQSFLNVGYGRTGTGRTGDVAGTSGDRRFGYNKFETTGLVAPGEYLVPTGSGLVADFDDGTAAHDALGRALGIHDLGLGGDEAALAPGDSGGPAFIYDGQKYLLAGVAVAVVTGGDADIDRDLRRAPTSNSTFGDTVGFTRVSRYADALDARAAIPYDLVVDLHDQAAGGDGQADRVQVAEADGVVTVSINGVVVQSERRDRLKSVTLTASADGGTVDVAAAVNPDLAVVAKGFTATDARPRVTAVPVNPVIQKTALQPADPRRLLAVGADAGGQPRVRVYNPDGGVRFDLLAFDASFTGGVRVALGDVNGDGYPDLIAGAGPGGPPTVRVFDGRTAHQLASVPAFEAAFDGGVYVAAGDFDGDGRADIVVTPDEGGGPRVRVLRGTDEAVIADFFGIEDTAFRGGARVAVGDLNGDGRDDLLVGAGFGGGPRVAGFDGRTLAGGPRKLFADFFVFEPALRNGVFLAAGDLDRDQSADVIVGGGPGGGPRVYAVSGRGLVTTNRAVQLANFFAGDTASRGGVRVAAKDVDGDGHADIVAGAGQDAGARVTVYAGAKTTPDGVPATVLQFDAFDGFAGGVFVG